MEKTSSNPYLTTLAGLIAAELSPSFDRNVLRRLVQYGEEAGYPMRRIYEEKRASARKARDVEAPSYEDLMS